MPLRMALDAKFESLNFVLLRWGPLKFVKHRMMYSYLCFRKPTLAAVRQMHYRGDSLKAGGLLLSK